MRPRSCLLWLLALCVAAFPARPALGQDKDNVPVIPFDGPEVFCYLLQHRNFKPVQKITDLGRLDPKEVVVIVFGENQQLDSIDAEFHGWDLFRQRGGSLLVASDYRDQGRLANLGVVISGDPVFQAANEAYKHESACPLLTGSGPDADEIFPGLKSLATNRPSYLSLLPRGGCQPLVSFPRACVTPGPGGLAKRLRSHEHYMVGILPDVANTGRALILAGHGLFTNGMMLQSDNDNFDFAVSCLRWLGESPDGTPRRHALFVLDGKVIQSFDVSLKPPPPPIPVPTIQLVNQLLHGLERENFFVRLLRDNVDVGIAIRLSLIVLTVCLLVYGALKLGEQRHHTEAGAALLVGPFAPSSVPAPLVQQRYQAQVQQDALWEDARALARQWFSDTCGVALTDWDRTPPDALDIETRGGWWAARRLRTQADSLWQLAGESVPTRLPWQELVRLTSAIQTLNQAIREGRLRVAGCSVAEKL